MQQTADVNQVSSSEPEEDKKIWNYSRGDLEEILLKVRERKQEYQESISLTSDSLVNKDDQSNGLEDSGISRGMNSNDVANELINNHSAEYFKIMEDVEKNILSGIYTSLCIKCNKHISLERLKFIPETRLCSYCATQ